MSPTLELALVLVQWYTLPSSSRDIYASSILFIWKWCALDQYIFFPVLSPFKSVRNSVGSFFFFFHIQKEQKKMFFLLFIHWVYGLFGNYSAIQILKTGKNSIFLPHRTQHSLEMGEIVVTHFFVLLSLRREKQKPVSDYLRLTDL